MRKNTCGLLFLLLCFVTHAQSYLSEQAVISMLTTEPCEEEIHTYYGHISIRVRDSIEPGKVIDYVFNYGQFDTSKPNFVYHFAKGELDYILAFYPYAAFAGDRMLLNANVYEQILNLTLQEKQDLWMALITNALPQNRTYRYDYFFDNCATRPANLLEQIVNGKIRYQEKTNQASFRDMINYCTRNNLWLTFGCDLALGLPTDRVATFRETFFIPEHLFNAYSSAEIENPDGSKRALVSAEYLLIAKTDEDHTPKPFFTPLVCSLLLFVIVLCITWLGWRHRKYARWLDCVLFFVAGIGGCVLFFLSFLSEQPCIWPNMNIVWLHPVHWVGAALFAVKKWNKAAYFYHFINFAALLLMSICWIFIPQHFNIAFIPLIAVYMLRSGYGLIRKKMNIE